MADWKKLAKQALLADGKIDAKETKIIRTELFADNRIDKAELAFLADLRHAANSCVPSFNKLFIDGVKSHLLEDGEIDDKEARWLRKVIFADGEVDKTEIKLLKELKAEAKTVSTAFAKLYAECVGE